MSFPRATSRVQNGVPRRSSVHSERPGNSSSIPLPFCRTLERKQLQKKAPEEEISLRSSSRNAILWPCTLCKFARSGLETIENISKTIAGSKRAWTLDWFSFVLLKVETKEVVDWRHWKRAAISNAPPRETKENSPRLHCNWHGNPKTRWQETKAELRSWRIWHNNVEQKENNQEYEGRGQEKKRRKTSLSHNMAIGRLSVCL